MTAYVQLGFNSFEGRPGNECNVPCAGRYRNMASCEHEVVPSALAISYNRLRLANP